MCVGGRGGSGSAKSYAKSFIAAGLAAAPTEIQHRQQCYLLKKYKVHTSYKSPGFVKWFLPGLLRWRLHCSEFCRSTLVYTLTNCQRAMESSCLGWARCAAAPIAAVTPARALQLPGLGISSKRQHVLQPAAAEKQSVRQRGSKHGSGRPAAADSQASTAHSIEPAVPAYLLSTTAPRVPAISTRRGISTSSR